MPLIARGSVSTFCRLSPRHPHSPVAQVAIVYISKTRKHIQGGSLSSQELTASVQFSRP